MPARKAELEAGLAEALGALIRVVEMSWVGPELRNAKRALAAWQGGSEPVLDCSPASRAPEPAHTHETSAGSTTTSHGGGLLGNEVEVSNEISIPITHAQSKKTETENEVDLVYAYFLKKLPADTRVHRTPGKGATRCIKRALKERPRQVLETALDGAAANWGSQGTSSISFRIERIFDTWKNGSSLAERIDWLASLAPQRALKDSVRSRVEDVRRDVRAALDVPTPFNLRRARDGEQWLAERALGIFLHGPAEDGVQRFSIDPGFGGGWVFP